MSEEALDSVPEGNEPADQVTEQPDQQIEQHVEQAADFTKGHISKEDWEAQGKDPKDWRSPELFEERGKWIKENQNLKQQIAQGQSETDSQIRNLNQLHQIQLQNTISDLETKRNAAIDEADTTTANEIQGQIDQTKIAQQAAQVQQQQQTPAEDPAIAAWRSNNAWVTNPADPKTPYAQQQFIAYVNHGFSTAQALVATDRDISNAFPQVNHNRSSASVAESGSKPGGKRSAPAQSVAWDQCSRQEQAYYESMPEAWGSQKDFLKAVANNRKGA